MEPNKLYKAHFQLEVKKNLKSNLLDGLKNMTNVQTTLKADTESVYVVTFLLTNPLLL